jgi:tetratricopeptide (TPR) repeat protein
VGARLQSAPTTSEGAVVADDVDGRVPSVALIVDPVSVVVALKAVLDSDAFRPAWRARDFLAYIVTETLQGRGQQLSERTVARWALGRGPDFDGRTDSSVRVQARRVRQGLDDYYAGEGAHDEVRIVLPTGTYVPEFVRTPAGPAEGRLEPGVVLLVPEGVGGDQADQIGRVLIEALAQRLASFRGISIVGPLDARGRDARRIATTVGASSVLNGSVVVRGSAVRLSLRLADTMTDEVLWAVTETRDLDAFSGFDAEDAWAAQLAGQLGDFAGVVLKHARVSAGLGTGSGMEAAIAFYDTVELGTVDSFGRAAVLLDRALDGGDRPPLLVAMRGNVLAVMAAYGLVDSADDAFHDADSLAREALAEDPTLWLAHIVLATTAVGRQHWDEAVAHADDAVQLAPQHPTALASAALICLRANDWSRAAAWADEALRLNPDLPAYLHVLLAVDCLLRGDDARALAEASLVDVPGMPWGPLYRALALSGLGRTEDAAREMREADRINPHILEDPRAFLLGGYRLDDEQLDTLLRLFAPVLDEARIPEQAGGETTHWPVEAAAEPGRRS